LNQLEGFTYRAKDFLDNEDFIASSTEEERASLKSKAEAAGEWIYSEGRDATREELKAKLKEMKDIVAPIETRREEAAARPAQVKVLQEALNQTKQLIVGITGQIENDTKLHSSFSASKSAAATATPSASVDDFAGLEDEDETATSSAPSEAETLTPPTYTTEDLTVPQTLYDSISEWLTEKLAEQEKLPPTADPVILVRDIAAKVKQLQDAQMALVTKSMRRPYQSKKPTKPKSTKSKKAKTSKTEAADAEKTIDFGGKPFIQVGTDDEMPSEEEILAWVEKQRAEEQAGKSEQQKEESNGEQAAEQAEGQAAQEEGKPAPIKHEEL
jgi:hypoxia up-regulated 1